MKSKAILLVDDEALILESLGRDLKIEGYGITTAENGERAIAIMKNKQFDLVITDLMMEGLDGIKVLKQAKKIDPVLPVIILTGYGDLTSAIDALRLGADDYLLKPCDIDELLFRISNCLEKQEIKRKIKLYEDILPVCSVCKKIRDDTGKEPGKGEWMTVEEYIERKAGVLFSHGYCKECYEDALKDIRSTKGK